MRSVFLPDRDVGAAVVRRSKEIDSHLPVGTSDLIALLRQSIRYEGGSGNEFNLTLHLFAVTTDFRKIELSAKARTDIVRLLMQLQRVRDTEVNLETEVMVQIENTLSTQLRLPTEDEISLGIRHAVWPIAVIRLI